MKRIARVQLRLTYRCCGMEWIDEYALVFPMPCPDCGVLIAAHDIVELSSDKTQRKKHRARQPRD